MAKHFWHLLLVYFLPFRLEIMESMAMHQEAAYERLYRWTQSMCSALSVYARKSDCK